MTSKPNHRSPLAETAYWTAEALALCPLPWADEIMLSAPGLVADEPSFASFRGTITQLLKGWVGATGRFHGVCVLSDMDGMPVAKVLARYYTGEDSLWKLKVEALDLAVVSVRDVSRKAPIDLAKELLAEPLAVLGLAEDLQLTVTKPFMARQGGLWLLSFGRPYLDEKRRQMSGVQAARDRAWELRKK
jgi:hypothetical protein